MHDKTTLADTLRLKLGLTNTEIQIVQRLIAWGSLAREQVCALTSKNNRPIKNGPINPIIGGLRRKLAKRQIQLATVRDLGFELHQKDRKKILKLLAKAPSGAATNGPATGAEFSARALRGGPAKPIRSSPVL